MAGNVSLKFPSPGELSFKTPAVVLVLEKGQFSNQSKLHLLDPKSSTENLRMGTNVGSYLIWEVSARALPGTGVGIASRVTRKLKIRCFPIFCRAMGQK